MKEKTLHHWFFLLSICSNYLNLLWLNRLFLFLTNSAYDN